MLPNEADVAAEVRRVAGSMLALSAEARAVAIATLPQLAGIDELPVAAGVLAKVIRLHRAVELLAGRGLAPEARVDARALFEAVVALKFLTVPTVELRQGSRVVGEGRPSRATRALMYEAHLCIDVLGAMATRPPRNPDEEKLYEGQRKLVERLRVELGAWADEIKRYYSGLNLEALCECLDMQKIRDGIYKPLSWDSHANTGGNHVRCEASGLVVDVLPTIDGACEVMHVATALVVCALQELRNDVAIGDEQRHRELHAALAHVN